MATVLLTVALFLYSPVRTVLATGTNNTRPLSTYSAVADNEPTLQWNNKTTLAVQRVDVCALNACEAYVRMRDDLANAVRPINDRLRGDGGAVGDRSGALEDRLQRLDRRLRSVEQPGKLLLR